MDDMSGLTTSPCHFSFGVEVVPVVRGRRDRDRPRPHCRGGWGVTYDAHIARAFRYAAAALVERPGDDVDRETIASFHRDAAVLLTETGTVATVFRPNRREGVRVEELARHPVRVMLTHLNTLAHPHTPSGDRPALPPGPPSGTRCSPTPAHGSSCEVSRSGCRVSEHRAPGPPTWAAAGVV